MATLNDLKAVLARLGVLHEAMGKVLPAEDPELWVKMDREFRELQDTLDEMQASAVMLEERGFQDPAEEMRHGAWVDEVYEQLNQTVDDVMRWAMGKPWDEYEPSDEDEDET